MRSLNDRLAQLCRGTNKEADILQENRLTLFFVILYYIERNSLSINSYVYLYLFRATSFRFSAIAHTKHRTNIIIMHVVTKIRTYIHIYIDVYMCVYNIKCNFQWKSLQIIFRNFFLHLKLIRFAHLSNN